MCGIWTQSLESQEEQLNICPAPDAVFVELAELAHQHLNIQSIPAVSQSLNIWKWNILTLSRTRGAAFPIFQVAAAAVFQTLHHQYLSLTHCSAREWQVYWRGFNSKNGRGGFPAELFRL